MYQSYLLLRNNEQSGPYSLEQLLQLELKPFDLVWEEGRSAAWRYPGEIDSLQAFMELPGLNAQSPVRNQPVSPADSPGTPKKVFVSMPGKKPAPAVPVNIEEPDAGTITGKIEPLPFSHPYKEKSEPAYSYFQKSTRKNKISARQIMFLSAVCLAAALSWYFISNEDVPLPDVKPPATILSSIPSAAPVENEANLPVPSLPEESKPKLLVQKDTRPSKKTRVDQPAKPEQLPGNNLAIITNPPPVINERKEAAPVDEADISLEEQPTPKKEKKKLREVVRNIFSPKERVKADVPADEAPLPATGRKASKRGNTGELVTAGEAVRNNIDISSNDKGNWMMGISGMKVTVRNRNNLPLASVVVTVSYLDVNNKLLEKKELNFRNISANGKMTLNAPEHRWADHTEISLASVETVKDAYAMDR